ncbi:HAD-IA family hydrolase [Arthrobacter sp. YN]|uniref:HAD-IA family hydrolase n=1 Tax=Arthrobacter sp. YN TaxID=2020486 RepID=UPI000B5E902E|nr:HAD-IA family hydrolase [Arthrobacter sp. YN]ASN22054.1 phosphatase [Arthrobacter sp. YN]
MITTTIPAVQAVLFDMDGTLIDSTANSHHCWSRWADRRGIADRSFQEWYEGIPARQIVEALVPAVEVDAALAEIVRIEATETHGITAFPGVPGLLASIPDTRKAIVTSSVRTVAAARLDAAGIIAPTVLVTAGETSRGKPDPAPFLLGAQRLKVDPRKVVVFEDAPAGIAAARAARSFVVAIEGTRRAADLAEADLVISGLDAVRVEVIDGGLQFYVRTA